MFRPTIGRRSFWRELDRLQREMNRVLDTGVARTASGFPPLNLWASDEHAMVTAELPGVNPDDIEISVVNDTVTLSGARELAQPEGGAQWHRRERWHGEFNRTLQLPFRIDGDRVEATYNNGVLAIALPRSEEDLPRRISVRGNGEGEQS